MHASTTTLVLFHGLASTPDEFSLLRHPLRRLGVQLVTPQVQGYSHGSLTRAPDWSEWIAAAGEALDRALGPTTVPHVLGGLCSGAMLAAGVAARRPDVHRRGLALLSPLFAYDGWGLPWWYRLRHLAYALGLADRFAMRERPPYGLKDERLRRWVREQMRSDVATLVGPAQVSLRAVRESERLSRHVRGALAGLADPLLVLHARDDEICDLRSVQDALSVVAPERLRLQVLEDSFHMITADRERDAVARALAAFVGGADARACPRAA